MATPVTDRLSINRDRLMQSIESLGAIGAYTDDATGLIGVRRLALSDEDRDGRRYVLGQMEQLNLRVSIDAIGNIYALLPGADPALAPVMMGSHVDSVPTGGRFDGALGVLGGLEVLRTVAESGRAPARGLAVGVFTDEEGCRFGTDMLGSAVATGRIALDDALALRDAEGKSVGDELARIGFAGPEPVGLVKPHAYLECHVEQGPVLVRAGVRVGVVTMVQSISWHEVRIVGRSAHAGATPTAYRKDAGLAAARLNVQLRQMVDSGRFGELRATMGVVSPQPNMINVIPGSVRATVDLRNPDDDAMRRAEEELHAYLSHLRDEDGFEITARQTARTPVVPFDGTLRSRIAASADARGYSRMELHAGAGHDAQEWARVCPAAMVFVAGEYDGISHNPRELSTPEQCEAGVNVLLDVALSLAEEQ